MVGVASLWERRVALFASIRFDYLYLGTIVLSIRGLDKIATHANCLCRILFESKHMVNLGLAK